MRRNPLARITTGMSYAIDLNRQHAELVICDEQGNVLGYLLALAEELDDEDEGSAPILRVSNAAAVEGYGPLVYEMLAYLGKKEGYAGLYPSDTRSVDADAFWARRKNRPFTGLSPSAFAAMFGAHPDDIPMLTGPRKRDAQADGQNFFAARYSTLMRTPSAPIVNLRELYPEAFTPAALPRARRVAADILGAEELAERVLRRRRERQK